MEVVVDQPIRLAATGFAEYVTSSPTTRDNKLPAFKFKHKGEGAGRSGYSGFALRTIARYHRSGRDRAVLQAPKQELLAALPDAKDHLARTKIQRNTTAIEAYERLYGQRRFKVLTNHRMAHQQGNVTVTAQPDLWVSEDDIEVLIKVGVTRKKPIETDMLLHLIRKAAIQQGYRVRARNVVYLDITTGHERICAARINRFNRTFACSGESDRERLAVHDGAGRHIAAGSLCHVRKSALSAVSQFEMADGIGFSAVGFLCGAGPPSYQQFSAVRQMPKKPTAPVPHRSAEPEVEQLTKPAFETFATCRLADIHHASAGCPIRTHRLERIAGVLTFEPTACALAQKIRIAIRGTRNQVNTRERRCPKAAAPMEIIYAARLR